MYMYMYSILVMFIAIGKVHYVRDLSHSYYSQVGYRLSSEPAKLCHV